MHALKNITSLRTSLCDDALLSNTLCQKSLTNRVVDLVCACKYSYMCVCVYACVFVPLTASLFLCAPACIHIFMQIYVYTHTTRTFQTSSACTFHGLHFIYGTANELLNKTIFEGTLTLEQGT
jgi:hypothetical protein